MQSMVCEISREAWGVGLNELSALTCEEVWK